MQTTYSILVEQIYIAPFHMIPAGNIKNHSKK